MTLPHRSAGADYPPLRARSAIGTSPAIALRLHLLGDPSLLRHRWLGLLSPNRLPPDLVPASDRLGRALAVGETPVVGGFHSPPDRLILHRLLRGTGPVFVILARDALTHRPPPDWARAIESSRLLIGSAPDLPRRPTRETATARNRLILKVSERLMITHAAPGSRTYLCALSALDAGIPFYCFSHPSNEDLLMLGARPVDPTAPVLLPGEEPGETGARSAWNEATAEPPLGSA